MISGDLLRRHRAVEHLARLSDVAEQLGAVGKVAVNSLDQRVERRRCETVPSRAARDRHLAQFVGLEMLQEQRRRRLAHRQQQRRGLLRPRPTRARPRRSSVSMVMTPRVFKLRVRRAERDDFGQRDAVARVVLVDHDDLAARDHCGRCTAR